ncbi:mercury methylation ferredoxin HgcB [uncultured Pseudodesulfovibrio sp.]|uniref:mercury methylation ferredoxin HgcB n=1 Tax=uncultured Pseudodesulfovibrio sp. TaxID=2035858 RepID=UPI0029C6BB32|nr:mercury methylation ferredoxin HgcB [uncultured Pseudodesulfovibrio sp.]
MKDFRYINGVSTLTIDNDACIGCGMCTNVCPHRVLTVHDRKAVILDFDGCMECGACAQNCPVEAVTVTPGVGCASLIITTWLHELTGRKIKSGCC